jgi:hypothetical protein
MFDEIVCRAIKQPRAPVVLAADHSADLQKAAALMEHVIAHCSDHRLASSLNRMIDRLNDIIAAGDCHRERVCFGEINFP